VKSIEARAVVTVLLQSSSATDGRLAAVFAASPRDERCIVTQIVVAVAFVVCSCVVANAEEPPALPKDVPPVISTAMILPPDPGYSNWSLRLAVPKVAWTVVGERKPKREWPEFKVEAEEATLDLKMQYDPATQLAADAQNRVLDLRGKRLSADEVFERLDSKTPVLVSVSGRMPDPFYLQCTKPDTLIVVLGIPSSPAPELLPQPASPPQVD